MEEMKKALNDEQLNEISGGANNGGRAAAKFNIGDWVRYIHNAEIVALITSRAPEEIGNGWKYGVKFNGVGQELRWVGENLMEKTSQPN